MIYLEKEYYISELHYLTIEKSRLHFELDEKQCFE